MTEPDGSIRPPWTTLVSLLDDLGPLELTRRWDAARRLIRENGITHNVYGDPNGLERPWNLDFVPLLIPSQEWRGVGDGLTQRAKLLDALLADIYGPARTVNEGIVPPELVYANPGFLRACHGVALPHQQWLHLYAADLVRAGDGRFLVLADRTQAPSGAGYSLENRIVLSGILPPAFKQCNVHRLAPFFITLRQTLASLAPTNRENPRVVLLTPGPYNETYFEHAYLARYLGYTLAQGNDLTVRDGRVFLKTLGGLQRVDVILRRVDDDFCDPLELFHHSFLGVPGLVEAVREGNVAVANALGSGTVQAPAFLPFLPRLCRYLLGEDLLIPSVQTWWCGDPDSLQYVIENLPRLVIKPAFPHMGSHPKFGEALTREQLDELSRMIQARPADFVAQEHVVSTSVPVHVDQSLQPRRFVVRAYLAASNGSYAVMPGGLTRITGSAESLVVSLQRGGGSKDTWVLSDSPVVETSLLTPASQPVELSRGGGDLPSRVADDLYWLGRYVQRAEMAVRIARCLFGRLMDQARLESPGTIRVLTRSLLGRTGPATTPGDGAARSLVADVFGAGRQGPIRPTIANVQILVRALRDRVSADAWRILQGIERDMSDFDTNVDDDQIAGVVELLNRLTSGFLAFGGVAADSMTRGQAWRFLDIGARLERALTVARLVRSTLVDVVPEEFALLDAVLEAADSSLTYRRRYLTKLEAPAVVDLLIADETNPRAVMFQLLALEEHLAHLPRESAHPQHNPDRQLVLQLRTEISLADLRAACQASEGGTRKGLDKLMTELIDGMARISEVVSQMYFSHAAISRRLPGAPQEMLR
jgi:uncharacterized circularly permuted ATP-grasp superfamily protein/uncharacterized alpha-E superfamily protein